MITRTVTTILAASVCLTACGTDVPVDGFVFPARDFQCASEVAEGGCATDTPVSDDASRTVALPHTFDDTTVAYVVSSISLPRAGAGAGGRDGAAGFNLDRRDTVTTPATPDSCTDSQPDFTSPIDAELTGVDNALQAFVPTIERLLDASACPGGTTSGCLDATLLRQIGDGSLILLVEVSGLNDYRYDDAVSVQNPPRYARRRRRGVHR